MSELYEQLEQMLKDCPILSDENFQKKYPGIEMVASFLNTTAIHEYRKTGQFEPFDRVGVNKISDYVKLIQQGNPDALKTYKNLRRILCPRQSPD